MLGGTKNESFLSLCHQIRYENQLKTRGEVSWHSTNLTALVIVGVLHRRVWSTYIRSWLCLPCPYYEESLAIILCVK